MKFNPNPKITLANQFKPSSNSIGFLRLVSAILVIIGHSFPYGGFGKDPLIGITNNQLAIGRFPVDLFFCLSGFLITGSYVRSKSLVSFLWHRFLRIYPAYWICIVITALCVPLIFSIKPDWSYVLHNGFLLTGIDNSIEGLFTRNPNGSIVNSALWTLPWECYAYLLVAMLGITGLVKNKWVMSTLFLIVWAAYLLIIMRHTASSNAAIVSPLRLICFFLSGTLIYNFQDKIQLSGILAMLCLLFLLMIIVVSSLCFNHSGGLFYSIGIIPFTYVVFWLSIKLPPPFRKVNSRYDYSYGIYIYGTLILNVLAALKVNKNYSQYLSFTLLITILIAALSWYLIEKPALRLKKVFDA